MSLGKLEGKDNVANNALVPKPNILVQNLAQQLAAQPLPSAKS